MRFNPPPNWPVPPRGWKPPQGWRPRSAWGPVPDGWELWVKDSPWVVRHKFWIGGAALVVAASATLAFGGHNSGGPAVAEAASSVTRATGSPAAPPQVVAPSAAAGEQDDALPGAAAEEAPAGLTAPTPAYTPGGFTDIPHQAAEIAWLHDGEKKSIDLYVHDLHVLRAACDLAKSYPAMADEADKIADADRDGTTALMVLDGTVAHVVKGDSCLKDIDLQGH